MAGWGSGPWGSSPWGTSSTPVVVVPEQPQVAGINVLAADTIEVVFSESMKNNDVLTAVGSYTVVPFAAGSTPVTVREVRAGPNFSALSVLLIVTPPTIGGVYDITVTGLVRSLDNQTLSSNTGRMTMRRTKIDSLLSTRPPVYDLTPGAVLRNVLNAIGREDDRIGGSQDEGEEIIR